MFKLRFRALKPFKTGAFRILQPSTAFKSTLPEIHIRTSSLNLRFPDAKIQPSFHYTWLRDNCQCPQCLHPSTRQKLISSAQIPLDIRPNKQEIVTENGEEVLKVVWSKPLEGDADAARNQHHESRYPLKWLLKNRYGRDQVEKRSIKEFESVCWERQTLDSAALDISYDEFMTEQGLYKFMEVIRKYGFGFITKVPPKDEQVEALALNFGPIRETFYGRSWDVRSVPNAKNIAYTSLFLGLHMDLMYFEAPPGLQFLHCLESSVQGGDSLFVDSFKAVEELRQHHPIDFEVLTSVPVTFHYDNNGHYLRYRRTTIQLDGLNQPYQVYYAPPFQGPMESNHDQVEAFYTAFKKFSSLLEDPKLLYQRKMDPGECVVFANRRVLHGRQAFDAQSGSRHLKGTYVDWDVLMDKYRVLSRKFNQ